MTKEKQELMTQEIFKKILDVFVEYAETDNDDSTPGEYLEAAALAFLKIEIETIRRSIYPDDEYVLQTVIEHLEVMKEIAAVKLVPVTKGANA